MKKLIFLITGIICSLSCMGQQMVLSDAANIKLPQRAEKLNREQVSSFASKKFNNDKIILNAIANDNTSHLYKVDDVLISINTATGSVEEGHLLNLKKGLDEMSKKDKSYTSSIKTINNNQVLIIYETSGNVGYYNFFCFNSTNTSAVSGGLQFDKADKDNAAKILDDVLNGIEFAK
jgi:hypothetical protein